MVIIPKPCAAGNFRAGRTGNQSVSAIVIHVMDGFLAGTDALFNQSPAERQGAQQNHASSAHYGISQTGIVHQYVQDADTAFHAGNVSDPSWSRIKNDWNPTSKKYSGPNPNAFTIGIEHEGTGTEALAAKLKLAFEWPDPMVQASAALVAQLCKTHSIPIDRDHIVGHHEIFAPKTCPGPAPMDRIVSLALSISQTPTP
jgi:N-acetylmuramoyl-L-alanine amidase